VSLGVRVTPPDRDQTLEHRGLPRAEEVDYALD
jgi:hypothetical protein